jgi:uncharacterized protein YraI
VVLRAAAGVTAIAAAGGIGTTAPDAIAQDERERVTRARDWEPGAQPAARTAVGSTGEWQTFETEFPFYAIGASWPADVGLWPVVEVKLSSDGATWSEAFRLAADNDAGGGPNATADRLYTPLIHSAGAQFAQFRTVDSEGRLGHVDGLRFTYIDATDGPWEKDISGEPASLLLETDAVDTTTPPEIVTRAGWGANEDYRFASYGEVWPPEYETVTHIIVHHTDTPNTQDIPTAVRSIYYYHAITQGWGDIGYNYLVGRDGRIYQGRYGGQNVIGGHSFQYAIGSSGICIIGDFQDTPVPDAALSGLVAIVAWVGRDLDPYGTSDFHETLDLPTICSHRDVNATTCPGDYLWNDLPEIRDMVAATLDSGDMETPFPGGIVVGDRVMVNTADDTSLNLRDAAGTDAAIAGSLAHGAFAVVVDGPTETDEGNWYLLDAEDGDLSGWAIADYLLVTPKQIDTSGLAYGTNIQAIDPVNIRSEPSTGGRVVRTAARDELGFIMAGPEDADGYEWYQIHWQDGTEGWSTVDLFAVSPVDENPPAKFAVGDYATATEYINVRVRPGLPQTIIASLGAGGSLQITTDPIAVNGYVWYGAYTQNDDGGWVVENTLRASSGPGSGKFAIGDTVKVTENLRLRTSASTSASTVAVMPAGTTGTVVGGPQTGSGYTWWQVQTSLGTGWAVQDWLAETDGGTTPPPSGKFEVGDAVRVTENMNLRSGPSTGNGVITVLPAGTTGTVVGGPRTGSGYTWWQIETSRGTGWVVEDWLAADGGTTPPPTGKFDIGDTVRVTENMNMRSGPSTSNGVVAVLPAGTTGKVLDGPRTGSGYTWWKLETSRGTGWAAQDWLVETDGGSTPPPPTGKFENGDVVRVTENLNMRSGASTGNGVIAVLPAGTTGTVVGGPQTGSGYTWWQIETSRGTGWVVEDWLAADGGGTTPPPTGKFSIGERVTTTDNLNMRSSPSTSSSVVRLLPQGTSGTVLDGPRTGSGYTWWQLDTSYGSGWVVEDWLT